MGKTVGLLGGTFDPVHMGHISIAESFLQSGLIDQLWILLTPEPPHKEHRNITSYSFRKKMLDTAFSEMEKVVISDVERQLPKPNYTIRTLRHLKKEYPDTGWYLCIGEDSLKEFDSWYHYRSILEMCELLVARRPGVNLQDVPADVMKRTHLVSHQPVDISSTELRNKLERGEDVAEYIPEQVYQLIRKEQPYGK